MSRSLKTPRRSGPRRRERASLTGVVRAMARGMAAGRDGDPGPVYRRAICGVMWLVLTRLARDRGRSLPRGAFASVLGGLNQVESEEAMLELAGPHAQELRGDLEWFVAELRAEIASGDLAEHEVIGAAYEELLEQTPVWGDAEDGSGRDLVIVCTKGNVRKSSGSYFTPRGVVEAMLDTSLTPTLDEATRGKVGEDAVRAVLGLRVCDPSCGVGHVLVGVVRRMATRIAEIRGVRRAGDLAEVVRSCVYGVDVNPLSVELCRAMLWLAAGGESNGIHDHVRCADALRGAPARGVELAGVKDADDWCERVSKQADGNRGGSNRWFHWRMAFPEVWVRGGFDVVVGNPPFLNQLESVTAMDRDVAMFLRARFEGAVRGYADLSAAFLALGVEIARPGGRVALVQPRSVLAAKDAGGVRARVESVGSIESVWCPGDRVFAGAMVQTCVPTIRVGEAATVPRREASGTWARFLAAAAGVPAVELRESRTLGDHADATADFRDQYYGLAGNLLEDDVVHAERADRERRFPRLITSGLIDLAECRWGSVPTRVLKTSYRMPRVDLERLRAKTQLGTWANERLVPKVLVATQTRVIEVVVDERGEWLPSVPVITVVPREAGMIWHVAAALASPVCTVISAREYAGTAMSPGAIKLSAKQVARLPAPRPGAAWDAAAVLMREAMRSADRCERRRCLRQSGEAILGAYGLQTDTSPILEWWWDRMDGARSRS